MTTEPTDAELDALRQADNGELNFVTLRQFRIIARAALAKWGTPPAVAGEPVAWYEYNADLDAWFLAYGHNPKAKTRPLVFGDTTSQPTHAQAGAVESAEFGQFLSDVLTAAGLVTHGKQCKALGERLADMCVKLRHHGIKGGQHGPS